jgi:hypothetical protein
MCSLRIRNYDVLVIFYSYSHMLVCGKEGQCVMHCFIHYMVEINHFNSKKFFCYLSAAYLSEGGHINLRILYLKMAKQEWRILIKTTMSSIDVRKSLLFSFIHDVVHQQNGYCAVTFFSLIYLP